MALRHCILPFQIGYGTADSKIAVAVYDPAKKK